MPEHLPGWYPDPAPFAPPGQQRYWDGSDWRPQVRAEQPTADGTLPWTSPSPAPRPTPPPVEPYVAPVRPLYVAPAPTSGPVPRSGLRAVPLWAKLAVPALAVLTVGGLAAGGTDAGPSPTTARPATTAPAAVSPAAAVPASVTVAARPASTVPAPTVPVTTAAPATTAPPVTTARPVTTAAPPTTAPTTTAPLVIGPGPSAGAVDPRYSTCREAKSRGLGPYVRGRDLEYDWYRDADSDGIVCE
jgi:hypothetical protein